MLTIGADEAGWPAVEFGLVAPLLLMVMIAIIEFGMIIYVTVLMEGGLREAAGYGITGQTPEGGDRMARFLALTSRRPNAGPGRSQQGDDYAHRLSDVR